ncbi:UDP-N-acetylglucosamine 1-carboxyvinyltransferase [Bdellovibrionota bacterium]
MEKLVIHGGRPLNGEIKVSGAKNSALPLLFATLLAPGEFRISNVPNLRDIRTATSLLKQLGAEVVIEGDLVKIWTDSLQNADAPYDLVKTMRASVLALGPLLARLGRARVSLPGGCAIGARPINLHLEGMRKFGAKIELEAGYVTATADRLKGANIALELPTVTGTENLMMLATAAEGETLIENAAREPEIEELANFLNAMGANIHGAGTDTITVNGSKSLSATPYAVMPDRIEAGTFLIAGAATRGDLFVKNADPSHLNAVISKLEDIGAVVTPEKDGIRIRTSGPLNAVDIQTEPFPGFPTDCQAQMVALLATARGTSTVVENVFENRFMHVQELQRMGANIKLTGNTAIIRGTEKPLSGAPVMATDLRASASLIIAGLVAESTTEVQRIYHLDRGYDRIEEKLKKVGADIVRV